MPTPAADRITTISLREEPVHDLIFVILGVITGCLASDRKPLISIHHHYCDQKPDNQRPWP
ncbi:hypothetical protein [Nocardia mexicana]|uniref:Uncharacterized protein n=1 Tax=Nocardia mexicana TaxID=279262 RepID=A0A370GP74_9NOCA|nr:hypothetical protein [Nocardia mexicana]RDI45321.1 hypothetical protein DFR68_11391 [Nocardia mexicana]